MNEAATCNKDSTPMARGGSASVRTAIISRLRRTSDPVAHERLSLLSAQLKDGAPARYIARQVELIGGGR